MNWVLITTVLAVIMGIFMMIFRMKMAQHPASIKKIILPPLFMSTGAFMFIFPMFRVPFNQVLEALLLGAFFSIFLIRSSKFVLIENKIYLQPSRVFPLVLISLLAIRTGLKLYFGNKVSIGETSGIFFLLGFGMIATWRIAMLFEYKRFEGDLYKEDRRKHN